MRGVSCVCAGKINHVHVHSLPEKALSKPFESKTASCFFFTYPSIRAACTLSSDPGSVSAGGRVLDRPYRSKSPHHRRVLHSVSCAALDRGGRQSPGRYTYIPEAVQRFYSHAALVAARARSAPRLRALLYLFISSSVFISRT
ncbi:hypothetical protein EVAR_54993_1 [Eumeta japonica]|uniref:Uncharacterized protein n=1 Tax=Eumeta variegata TaxID=151549 RepID=A0A4C1Z1M8_EUMVA|nr:hypothetical protein EVAR_54993_1 [Eumeta japonica]